MDLSITHDFCEFIIEEETRDDLSFKNCFYSVFHVQTQGIESSLSAR